MNGNRITLNTNINVKILLSEDFQHGQLLDGVRIVNPFIRNEFWSVKN
jgi:predicted nucleic acid-binding protein